MQDMLWVITQAVVPVTTSAVFQAFSHGIASQLHLASQETNQAVAPFSRDFLKLSNLAYPHNLSGLCTDVTTDQTL